MIRRIDSFRNSRRPSDLPHKSRRGCDISISTERPEKCGVDGGDNKNYMEPVE